MTKAKLQGAKSSTDSADTFDGLYCMLCKITILAEDQKEGHLAGKKHKAKVSAADDALLAPGGESESAKTMRPVSILKKKAESGGIPMEVDKNISNVDEPPKKDKVPVERVRCETCDIELSSASQFALHITGRKHKNKLGVGPMQNPKVPPTPPSTKAVATAKTKETKKIADEFPVALKKNDSAPPKKAKQKEKTVVIVKTQSELDWAMKKFATARKGKSSSGEKINTEEAFFEEKEVFCGICLVEFTSLPAAKLHFSGLKHKGRAKRDGEEGGEVEEWCKVCRVDLASPYAANLHYKGDKHRSKIIIVAKLSAFDEEMAERLNPMPSRKSDPDFQPGFGYLNNKRPSFNLESDSSHGGHGGPPPRKMGRGAGGPPNHLYSSFIPGGTMNPDRDQQHHGFNQQGYLGNQSSYKGGYEQGGYNGNQDRYSDHQERFNPRPQNYNDLHQGYENPEYGYGYGDQHTGFGEQEGFLGGGLGGPRQQDNWHDLDKHNWHPEDLDRSNEISMVDWTNKQQGWQDKQQGWQDKQHGWQDKQHAWQDKKRGSQDKQHGWQDKQQSWQAGSKKRPGLGAPQGGKQGGQHQGQGHNGAGRGRGGNKSKQFTAPGKSNFDDSNSDKLPTGGGYPCDVCSITLNSSAQMSTHLSGTKHKENVSSKGKGPLKGGAVVGVKKPQSILKKKDQTTEDQAAASASSDSTGGGATPGAGGDGSLEKGTTGTTGTSITKPTGTKVVTPLRDLKAMRQVAGGGDSDVHNMPSLMNNPKIKRSENQHQPFHQSQHQYHDQDAGNYRDHLYPESQSFLNNQGMGGSGGYYDSPYSSSSGTYMQGMQY